MKKLNKLFYIRKYFAAFILAAAMFILNAQSAHGQFFSISNIAIKAIGKVFYAINYVIGLIAAMFFKVGGFLINFALELNSDILNLSAVQIGWTATRDLANLGFVLAIIIIAFATILRMENYGAKNALWKLIVAALLVNFSLTIAGVFIDFAGILTNFFISKAIPEPGLSGALKFADALAGAFNAQQFLKPAEAGTDAEFIEGLPSGGKAMFLGIVSIFFVAFFTLVGAIALIAIAVMLIIRLVFVSFFVIGAPLAFLMWVLPATQHLWNKWWNEFIRWVMFMPAVTFFIYLAVYTMYARTGEVQKAVEAVSIGKQDLPIQSFSENLSGSIAEMVLIVGFLILGLVVANKFGIHSAATFYGLASGAVTGFGRWTARLPARIGVGVLRTGNLGVRMGGALEQQGQQLQQSRGKIWSPITRATGRTLSGIGGGLQRATTYRAPTLFQSVSMGMRQRGRPERPKTRIEALRAELKDLQAQRKTYQDILKEMERQELAASPGPDRAALEAKNQPAKNQIQKELDKLNEAIQRSLTKLS